MVKPLGRKNYGSIGHLPSSRMGPADHSVHDGQRIIATVKARDRHDVIHVTEKLDGSNVGIANVDGRILALGRAGHLAQSSKYRQHQIFAAWVRTNETLWSEVLAQGERMVGEWMAQAHGTRYSLPHGPFAAFDLMVGDRRLPFAALVDRCRRFGVPMPRHVHSGGPISVEAALALCGFGDHGCLDEMEGVVYRVERHGEFDFMAKWVRPDKVDGKYLDAEIWNWQPVQAGHPVPD